MSLPRITALLLTAIALPLSAMAQGAPAPAAADKGAVVTKGELPALVKEAIMNEPEIIMEAVKLLREKQRMEAEKKTKEAITANKDALYKDVNSPSVGNPNGDVTIVEFFDYHCGYCKHILPVITQIVKEDPKVHVIFKEFPILSPDSVKASRAAIAVNRIAKDKYFEFHTGLMQHEGEFDEKSLTEIAKKAGVDAEKMIKEMASETVTKELDSSRELGQKIGVSGTPALILNDHFLPGAVSIEELRTMIKNVRAGKKPDYAEEKPEDKKKDDK